MDNFKIDPSECEFCELRDYAHACTECGKNIPEFECHDFDGMCNDCESELNK